MIGITVKGLPVQVQVVSPEGESTTYALGDDLVVVRPSGCYCRTVFPQETGGVPSAEISKALASIALKRSDR